MQKADRQLITFALTICITCSVLLSAVAAGLRARQDMEVALDRKRNVLMALGQPTVDAETGRKLSSEQLLETWALVNEIWVDADTGEIIPVDQRDPKAAAAKEQLELYIWEENGEPVKYAFPVSGKGLWSTIYGFLALENDLATIAGITFFKHGETPGLGGEIEKPDFTDQFAGQRLLDEEGEPVTFRVVKGGVEARYPEGNPYAVDGLSGATITGEGVASFITEDFQRYNDFFSTLRSS
jgi:Na+-transporting NADH:ubiquinone oxidoreductase subunit C